MMWIVTAVYQGRVNREDEKTVMMALKDAFAGRLSDDKINIHLELGGGMPPTATFTLNPLTWEEALDLFDVPYEISTMGLVSKFTKNLPDPPDAGKIYIDPDTEKIDVKAWLYERKRREEDKRYMAEEELRLARKKFLEERE